MLILDRFAFIPKSGGDLHTKKSFSYLRFHFVTPLTNYLANNVWTFNQTKIYCLLKFLEKKNNKIGSVLTEHKHNFLGECLDWSWTIGRNVFISQKLLWTAVWLTHSTILIAAGMVGACFAVCIVAMLYEGLKVLRETLLRRSLLQVKRSKSFSNGSTSTDFIAPPNTTGWDVNLTCALTGMIGSCRPVDTGLIWEQCPPNFLCPEKCIKRIINTKILPPKMYSCPSNLKTWLWVWVTVEFLSTSASRQTLRARKCETVTLIISFHIYKQII